MREDNWSRQRPCKNYDEFKEVSQGLMQNETKN